MKRLILLFGVSLLLSGGIVAQSISKFYAIDGTEWVNKYDRDKKERLLWQKIDLNLKAAQIAGRLGEDKAEIYLDAFQKLFTMCKESVETLRLADSGKEIMQNAEFRFYLSENGIRARTGLARNNEVFNLEEYANCFDMVLKEYAFNSEITEELSDINGKEYNLDFVVSDFAERMDIVMDRIERELSTMEFKERMIMQMVPKYNEAKRILESKAGGSKTNKNRRQK